MFHTWICEIPDLLVGIGSFFFWQKGTHFTYLYLEDAGMTTPHLNLQLALFGLQRSAAGIRQWQYLPECTPGRGGSF